MAPRESEPQKETVERVTPRSSPGMASFVRGRVDRRSKTADRRSRSLSAKRAHPISRRRKRTRSVFAGRRPRSVVARRRKLRPRARRRAAEGSGPRRAWRPAGAKTFEADVARTRACRA